jgi:hypothetical protein
VTEGLRVLMREANGMLRISLARQLAASAGVPDLTDMFCEDLPKLCMGEP